MRTSVTWTHLAVGDVDAQVDVPEGARADLAHDAVLARDHSVLAHADAERHDGGRCAR